MIKILSVISNNIESGGVENYLINAYHNIDLAGTSIDLIVPGNIIYEKYALEFQKIGCNIITFGLKDKYSRILKFYYYIKKIMIRNHYDLIHVNTGNIVIEAIALNCALKAGIPIRIAHSHGTLYNTGLIHEKLRAVLRMIINKSATYRLACSKPAAESLFGKSNLEGVIIVPNGIDSHKYTFSEDIRRNIRREYNWEDKYIIGSVGRLAPEKNYSFLLQVFKRIKRKSQNQDCRLVIIGDGEERDKLKNEADILGLINDIDFMGVREDVPYLMQGMDVFTLVSKREALGIVNIEAQATGLPCVVSDVITKDIDISGNVCFLSLTEDQDIWARELLRYKYGFKRTDNTNLVIENGYDFTSSYRALDTIYHEAYRSIC